MASRSARVHHAAFDTYIIGVTPGLKVKVRLDVLEETDGPMLQHGLQSFQGRRIDPGTLTRNSPGA